MKKLLNLLNNKTRQNKPESRKIRLVFTVTNDLSYDQRMDRICSTLTTNGYSVLLVGFERRKSAPLAQRRYSTHRMPCFFQKGKLFYVELNLRLFFFLLFQPLSAICAIDLDTLLPAFLVSKIRSKICFYDAHEYFTETPEVVRRPLIQKTWEKLAALIVPRIKYCYTVGPMLAEVLEERYKVPFKVIRNVPYTLKVESIPPQTDKTTVLIYQGMLNEGRGLEQMIQALDHLPNVELWLVGEGDRSEQLRVLVRNSPHPTRIKFLGLLPPEKLKLITPQATIGLNLLENKGKSYYYSLANKAFDYIQAGIPSIQMNFPEYQRLNQEHEVFCLVKNLDPTTLSQAVHRLVEDTSYYQKLTSNCQIARKKWNWEHEQLVLLEIYEEALKQDHIEGF